MPKGLQCYFTSFCNVSFSSFLMNECQNIELDELLFCFFTMSCILNLSLVFIFHFNCQYVYNAERSVPFEFQLPSTVKILFKNKKIKAVV